MAKLADALASGASLSNQVQVQVLLKKKKKIGQLVCSIVLDNVMTGHEPLGVSRVVHRD